MVSPVETCRHKRVTHVHGTYAAYTLDHCRCRECALANSVYEQRRKRRNAYGRSNLVDAEPVRAHVRSLMAAGMGWKRVCQQAGVAHSSVFSLLYGKSGRPLRRITRANADALLGVQLERADGSLVDAVGARRRVQALMRNGWSVRRLASTYGLDPQRLYWLMGHAETTWRTAVQVAEIYRRIGDRPGGGKRVQRYAESMGWPLPIAWDEDTIDDPTALPAQVMRTRTSNRIDDVVEDVEWIVAHGGTMAQACGRLEYKQASLERVLERAGRGDLISRLKGVQTVVA